MFCVSESITWISRVLLRAGLGVPIVLTVKGKKKIVGLRKC